MLVHPARNPDSEDYVTAHAIEKAEQLLGVLERIANTLQRLQHVVDLAYRQGWGSPPVRRD